MNKLEIFAQLNVNINEDGFASLDTSSYTINFNKNGLIKIHTDDGLLTKRGAEIVTTVLTETLNAHIHACNKYNIIKDSDHLRSVINSLEKSFASASFTSEITSKVNKE